MVFRTNDVVFEFTIANFPLIKVNVIITVMNLGEMDKYQFKEKVQTTFIIGYANIKSFIEWYYSYLVKTTSSWKLTRFQKFQMP